MSEPQLDAAELEVIRALRNRGLTYEAVGAALGITGRSTQRILTIPDWPVADRTLLKIRTAIHHLQAEDEERSATPRRGRVTRRQRAAS